MTVSVGHLVVVFSLIALTVQGAVDSQLTGTWTTKSRQVFTGPGFYDPVKDRFIEPSLTGISYSFSEDGYYEEAYYRAIADPTNPQCVSGLMQWQHGTYSVRPDGSLLLEPFTSDGRQLTSSPCENPQNSVYLRYNQTETFKRYSVYTDTFHNVLRLDLFQFDGSPMSPMYLAYKPPQMLPTQTLNPTAMVHPTGNAKRSLSDKESAKKVFKRMDSATIDQWWWIGVVMTSVGGIVLLCS